MACALGTALVGASLASATTAVKHHRKTAATAHVAALRLGLVVVPVNASQYATAV